MYQERMLNYLPPIISALKDFQAIVAAEYPEFENLESGRTSVLNNAYLTTMEESRVIEWEKILGIKPLEGSSISDRRETIIARIRGQGKLNTELINSIVKTFTGGTANSWVEDSVLYVEITPPPDNKQYIFANVEQELAKKIPAHLGFQVSRNYMEWGEVTNNYSTWQDVKDNFDTWNEVYIFSPFE